MENRRTLAQLIDELEQEAYYHGREKALYDHCGALHNVQQRQAMLRREALREQVKSEILHKLKERP